jgi:hypothetical protein
MSDTIRRVFRTLDARRFLCAAREFAVVSSQLSVLGRLFARIAGSVQSRLSRKRLKTDN